MIYLDTSALVKLYLLESDSSVVQEIVASQHDPLPIWELQEMELTNALRLKVFWDEISQTDAEQQLGLFEERKQRGHYFFPDLDRAALFKSFQRLSAHTPRLGCRTLDIMHVACACVLETDGFMSFDSRQLNLAELAGLKVLPTT